MNKYTAATIAMLFFLIMMAIAFFAGRWSVKAEVKPQTPISNEVKIDTSFSHLPDDPAVARAESTATAHGVR